MTTTAAQVRNSIRIALKEMSEPCPAYRARCANEVHRLGQELADLGRAVLADTTATRFRRSLAEIDVRDGLTFMEMEVAA
jgi:hypothetical protein